MKKKSNKTKFLFGLQKDEVKENERYDMREEAEGQRRIVRYFNFQKYLNIVSF